MAILLVGVVVFFGIIFYRAYQNRDDAGVTKKEIDTSTKKEPANKENSIKSKIASWKEKREAEISAQRRVNSIHKEMERRSKESYICREDIYEILGKYHVYFEYIIKGERRSSIRKCDLDTQNDAEIMLEEFRSAFHRESARVSEHHTSINQASIIIIAIIVIFIFCL